MNDRDRKNGDELEFLRGFVNFGTISAAKDKKKKPKEFEFEIVEDGDDSEAYITPVKYLGSERYVRLPREEQELPIYEIGAECFAFNQRIEEVDLSDTDITYIAEGAFRGCTALKKVIVPDGDHLSVGENAFEGCVCLEYIGTDKDQGEHKFEKCLCLNVHGLDMGAFKDCTGIEAIYINEAVFLNSYGEIADEAFAGCTRLKSVELKASENPDAYLSDDDLIQFGHRVFRGCTALREFSAELPKCRVKFADDPFDDAQRLESIKISGESNIASALGKLGYAHFIKE